MIATALATIAFLLLLFGGVFVGGSMLTGFFGGVLSVLLLIFGLASYILAPIIAGLVTRSVVIGHFYGNTAMVAIKRGLLLAKREGGYQLYTWWKNAESGFQEYKMGDDTKEFLDPSGHTSYCYDEPLAIINEGESIVRTPFHAEVGEYAGELVDRDIDVVEDSRLGTLLARFAEIPHQLGVINPLGRDRAIPGSASAESKSTVKEHTLKSQLGFGDGGYTKGGILVFGQMIIAFIISAIITSEFAGGDGTNIITDGNETVITGSINFLMQVPGVFG